MILPLKTCFEDVSSEMDGERKQIFRFFTLWMFLIRHIPEKNARPSKQIAIVNRNRDLRRVEYLRVFIYARK